MAERKDQAAHDAMILSLTRYLSANGFTDIKADLPSYPRPSLLRWQEKEDGHIPDATAVKNKKEYIFEVETEDSITHLHTEDQWALFAASANLTESHFYVVVPEGYYDIAKRRLNQLRIGAFVWTLK